MTAVVKDWTVVDTGALERFGLARGGAPAEKIGEHLTRVEARLRTAQATADPVELAAAIEELADLRRAVVARGVLDLVAGPVRHARCEPSGA